MIDAVGAPGSPARSRLTACLLIVGLGLVTDGLFTRESGPRMEQASSNVRFAERPSLARALSGYPRLWPPLYPLLLRGWMRGIGLPPLRMNETLFLATLPLLWLACREVAPGVHPLAPALFWSVAHFNHADFYQLTADALVTPLMLAFFLLLLGYARKPSAPWLVTLLLVSAALLTSRYFSLFVVPPVVLSVILSVPGLDLRGRLRHALGLLLALAPAFAWMVSAWLRTGFVTGADRQAARQFPAYLQYWSQLQSPTGNLYAWSKTLFLDLFSTRRHGALAFVTTEYEVYPLEWMLLTLAFACAGIALLAWLRRRTAPLSRALHTPIGIALALFAVHNLMLLVVWTLGNNDPLHSRYLWPSYAMLVLFGLAAYASVRSAWARAFWPALPFRLLLALLLVVHVQRSLAATPEPVGYELEPEAETLEP